MAPEFVTESQQISYRGSTKHKNRPLDVRKGTLCPEWTHQNSQGGFQKDPYGHDWASTAAQKLFDSSVVSQDGRRRFATSNGIAFEAKPTADGTWHGYPIPWEHVPPTILHEWQNSKKISRREVKKYWTAAQGNIQWALRTDDT
jgi:hypothetical protein